MFYATGMLYFVWPVLPLTLLTEYIWDLVAICLSFLPFSSKVGVKQLIRRHYFPTFVVSFGCNAFLFGLILILEAVGEANPAFADALESPFANVAGMLVALLFLLLVLVIGLVKGILYDRIVYRRMAIEVRCRRGCLVLLSLLTVPWLFLMPTAFVADKLGSLLIWLGSLSGITSEMMQAATGGLP